MAVENVRGQQIVNLESDANYYFEVAPQGDSQARSVIVSLITNNADYVIPAGSTAIIEGKNAGGFNIFNQCTVLDDTRKNKIEIPLTNGILSFAGVGKYVVAIYNGSNYITSFPFNIVVTEAPYDIERLEGSDSYEALNLAIAKALSANKWWVQEGNPMTTPAFAPETMGASEGDYYMDAQTGNVYYTKYNTAQELIWSPVTDITDPSRIISVQQKVYIRYSANSDGSGMTPTPTSTTKYIGVFTTNLSSADPQISIPSNYQWSRLLYAPTSTTAVYGVSTSTTTEPSSYSSTIPVVPAGSFLWTKVTVVYENGYNSVFKFTSGPTAGFGTPTSSMNTVLETYGVPKVRVTASGANTAKEFNFDFAVRGAHWKVGEEINDATLTSDKLKAKNTIVGDMYLNIGVLYKGYVYRCIEVTNSNSTWEKTNFALNVVTNINDLANTKRFYGTLAAGSKTLTISETGLDEVMFNTDDAIGTNYFYRTKVMCSDSKLLLIKNPTVTINTGSVNITLNFIESISTPAIICVEIIKKANDRYS